jgi:hypothetical protein
MTRSRSEADDEDDGDVEHNIKRQRMINELGQQELQTINLQIELMEKRNRLAQLQENETWAANREILAQLQENEIEEALNDAVFSEFEWNNFFKVFS